MGDWTCVSCGHTADENPSGRVGPFCGLCGRCRKCCIKICSGTKRAIQMAGDLGDFELKRELESYL